MLKSCRYCGRIHDERAQCSKRDEAIARRNEFLDHTRKDRGGKEDRFRHTGDWKKMRDHVLHRDRRLCLCCLAGLKGTQIRYETRDLSVHHITPLKEDYSKRLDESNLITVCTYHHELCEKGGIDRDRQRELVEMSMNGAIMRVFGVDSGCVGGGTYPPVVRLGNGDFLET